MPRLGNDKIGRAGEHYVAAELNRRGAYASPFSGNVPDIDIVATDDSRERVAFIQVKTKARGNWQVRLKVGWAKFTPNGCPKDGSCGQDCRPKLCEPVPGKENHYWAFVSLQKDGGQEYYIVPDDQVRSLVREGHMEYLGRHGGQRRGKNHDSDHHSITDKAIETWKDQWDALGLWPESEQYGS